MKLTDVVAIFRQPERVLLKGNRLKRVIKSVLK